MRRSIAFVLVASLTVAACSPGPHDNPVIGLLAMWLAAVSVVALIGGIAWLRRHRDGPRLPTLLQGIARALGATLLVSAVVVGLLYAGMQLRLPADQNLGYWSIDDRTLGVVVFDSPQLMCGITGVEETSDIVRIHAQCAHPLVSLGSLAMAHQYVYQVALEAPLGIRAVENGSGKPAMACLDPAPNCIVP